MSKHDNKIYLGHILEFIKKIQKYVVGYTFDDFKSNDKTIDAVVRNLEIIGEASNNLSKEFRDLHHEVDFRPAVDMRNRLSHGYDDINLKTVWDAIQDDLPEFKNKIESLLNA